MNTITAEKPSGTDKTVRRTWKLCHQRTNFGSLVATQVSVFLLGMLCFLLIDPYRDQLNKNNKQIELIEALGFFVNSHAADHICSELIGGEGWDGHGIRRIQFRCEYPEQFETQLIRHSALW